MTNPVDRYDDLLTQLAGCARSMLQQIEDARREQREDFGKVRDVKAGDVVILGGSKDEQVEVRAVMRCVHDPTRRDVFTTEQPRCLDADHPIQWVRRAEHAA